MRALAIIGLILAAWLAFVPAVALGQRLQASLDGDWRVVLDAENTGLEQQWWLAFPAKSAEAVSAPFCLAEYRFATAYRGIAWARRDFTATTALLGKRVCLVFDSAGWQLDCWLNGQELGSHQGDLGEVAFEVTKYLNYGGPNQLVVRLAPREGGEGLVGLYGSTWLEGTAAVQIASLKAASDAEGKLQVSVQVDNPFEVARTATLSFTVTDPETKTEVATVQVKLTAEPGLSETQTELLLPSPTLWSPLRPFLYRLDVTLVDEAGAQDSLDFALGARDFGQAEGRFMLNGKPLPLITAEIAPYFPGSFRRAPTPDFCAAQVAALKKTGFNCLAVEAAYAPKELLEAADKQGLLVLVRPGPGESAQNLGQQFDNHPAFVAWLLSPEQVEAGAFDAGLDPARLRLLDTALPVVEAGGMTNLPSVLEAFGNRKWLPDYLSLKAAYEAAGESWQSERLGELFGTLPGLASALQRDQGRRLQQQIDQLRASADFAGYRLRWWQDNPVNWTSGLVDPWGQPKASGALTREANQPVRVLLSTSAAALWQGQPVMYQVQIANLGQDAGPAELLLIFESPKGKVLEERMVPTFLEPKTPVKLVTEGDLRLTTEPGQCRLLARLSQAGKEIARTEVPLVVVASESPPASRVLVLDYGSDLLPALQRAGYNAAEFADIDDIQGAKLALVGALPDLLADRDAFRKLAQLKLFAENGGVVFFTLPVRADLATQALGLQAPEAVADPAALPHYLRKHPLLEGLAPGGLAGPELDSLVGQTLIGASGVSLLGTLSTDGTSPGACLLLQQVGKGGLLWHSLDLPQPGREGPIGQLLWSNLVKWSATLAVDPVTVDQDARGVRRFEAELRRLQADG